MRTITTNRLFLLLTLVFVAGGCKKNDDSFRGSVIASYLPMTPGKYIHYRLDSTRFVNFGQSDTTISYDAKDVVDAAITDNQGRPSYRVIRYLRDIMSTDTADYTPAFTYMVTPTNAVAEVVEENLRFQKLKVPFSEGFSWRGNVYLPTAPYYDIYQFNNDEDIALWDYTYQNVNQPAQINGVTYDSTLTVLQVADSSNVPIVFPDGLAYKNYWLEQYAKNIGLIYRETEMWEYQPPKGTDPGYFAGFGIRLSIIDHN